MNGQRLDPTDPAEWGPAVERMASKLMDRVGVGDSREWQMIANDALTIAFEGLDPKDTQRVFWVYMNERS